MLDGKRFFIVLDDMGTCDSKDEWENFLAPLSKSAVHGSVVLVTTHLPRVAAMAWLLKRRLNVVKMTFSRENILVKSTFKR